DHRGWSRAADDRDRGIAGDRLLTQRGTATRDIASMYRHDRVRSTPTEQCDRPGPPRPKGCRTCWRGRFYDPATARRAGITSARQRSSCPRWSGEVKRMTTVLHPASMNRHTFSTTASGGPKASHEVSFSSEIVPLP